jgi:hypothetical protein
MCTALTVGQDSRKDRHHAVDRPADIDPVDPVPIGKGRQLGRPDQPDPSVVHQHMDLAELGLGQIGRGGELFAVSHVELDRQHLVPARQLSRGGAKVVGADIRDHHLHPGAEQRLGDPEANAGSAACDKGGLAFQVLHVTLHLAGNFPLAFLYMLHTNCQEDSTGQHRCRD